MTQVKIAGNIQAYEIDTRGLTINDPFGNVIFGAGYTVPLALLPAEVLNSNTLTEQQVRAIVREELALALRSK